MGDQERKTWEDIFKKNHGHANGGVNRFRKELPKVLGVTKRRVTRGHIAHALYRSGVARSAAEAETLCDRIDEEGKLVVPFGEESYHLTRQSDGRYKSQMRTTNTGVR
jgi:hypothetical protein